MSAVPLRLLVVPDSFKGSLSARKVAEALSRGARLAAEACGIEVAIESLPASDGGEGFLEAVEAVIGGERRVSLCRSVDIGAMPRPVPWLWHAETGTAYGEAAQVVGLHRTHVDGPLSRTALGVGDYIEALSQVGCQRLVLGIGGTASVDGGASVAAALGATFRRVDGAEVEVVRLTDVRRASCFESKAPRREAPSIACWCDVETPLTGPAGAVPLFAPQKGADPQDVVVLEEALQAWVGLAEGIGEGADPQARYTGSGGGIPFGVQLTRGAHLRSGGEAFAELAGLKDRVAGSNLVWTGEGALDDTTGEGKWVSVVARCCAEGQTPLVVFTGYDGRTSPAPRSNLTVRSLVGPEVGVEEAIAETDRLLTEAASEFLTRWLVATQGRAPRGREER